MTTTLFMVVMIVVSVLLIFVCGFPAAHVFESIDAGLVCGIIIAGIFCFGYCKFLTPSTEQMIENDYYAMMKDKPKCIDSGHVNLDCRKDYIEWQRDSVEKRHKYDSVKVVLDNIEKDVLK